MQSNNLHSKQVLFDLNSDSLYNPFLKRGYNEFRQNGILVNNGLPALVAVSLDSKAVSRQSQNQAFFLCGTFSCHGFCSAYLYRKSLRDVEAAFNAIGKKAYHMGIKSKIAKSTLADANEQRNWQIYADFAQVLIAQARKLYADEPLDVQWDGEVYAIDATTIDLCLSVFPWAKFQRAKAAIKLHTKINLRGNIPEFIHISDGKLNDVNALDLIVLIRIVINSRA